MTHERRRDVRIRVVLPAHLSFRERDEPVEIVEASFRGLLLKVHTPPVLNELMKLRITIANKVVTLYAVPVRETSHRGACAVGCKLFALGGFDKDEWQAFIAGLLRANVKAA